MAAALLLPMGSPWRATALLLLGMAHLAVGDPGRADGQFAKAVELAEDSGAPAISALALAERAWWRSAGRSGSRSSY